MTCKKCKSERMRRSMRRTPFDYIAAFFSLAPFRCARCYQRRYRFVPMLQNMKELLQGQ